MGINIMKITEWEEHGITIFKLVGRVDSEGSRELEQTLHSAVVKGHFRLVLDMAEVEYINSSGLRVLADILTANRASGGNLHIAAPSKKVRRVFEIVGFHNFFRLFEDTASAVASYR
jgi:anti-anti-sigma factor